jgi:hypothetical protein
VVDDDGLATDEHERTGLAVVQLDRAAELLEALAAAVVDVVHRAGVGSDVHARGLAGDLLPDVALDGARLHPGGEALAGGGVLHPAQRGIGGLGRGSERLTVAAAVPAPGLDAADGQLQLRARADQDRDVERPVLLGTEHLFALVEQHCGVRRVGDDEVVDGGAVGELLDADAGRPALRERDVVQLRLGAEEREHGEWAVGIGLVERDRAEVVAERRGLRGILGHDGLLSVRKESSRPKRT